MALDEAFHDIVLHPLRTPEMLTLVKEFDQGIHGSRTFDHYIREIYLGRGQKPCTDRNRALFYCYTYLYQHLDAYKRVIEREQQFFEQYIFSKLDKVGFVDVGCGPMTSCLALADYFQRGNTERHICFNYVGYDREFCMTNIAAEFSRRKDLFSEEFRCEFPDGQHPLDIERLKLTIRTGGTLIFNFAYFFGQEGVRQDLPNKVQLVKSIAKDCKVDGTFVIYLNKDFQGDSGAYPAFKAELKLGWNPVGPISYGFRYLRQLDKQHMKRQSPPTLCYEIQQLDWKKL